MRSRAQIKSHPIHPILVSFPIVFFIGTWLFDVLLIATGNEGFAQTAKYLNIAGIAGALLAAIPGFIDYLYTVPPQSSAKDRAAKHGITNVGVLLIFVLALILRNNTTASIYLITALELAGVVLLSIAGWMGGTLVYRNQIGTDIRYANAGKWKEMYVFSDDSKIKVAAEDELELNQMKLLHINDKRIVLARTEDGYVAFEDKCTHRGGSLAGGSIMCGTVQCPWHGSQFDVKTGVLKAGPAEKRILTYKVSMEDGKVYLQV